MLQPIPIYQLDALASAVVDFGGTIPPAIAEVLDLHRAATEATRAEPRSLSDRHRTGDLTAGNFSQALAEVNADQLRRDYARGVMSSFESYLVGLLTPLVRGEASDRLVKSLKPTADKHLAVMRRAAAANITERTTAEDILDSTASDRKLWRDVETAAHALNALHNAVIVPLVVEMGVLGDIRAPGGPSAVTHAMWNVGPFDTRGSRASHKWLRCHDTATLLVPSEARERLDDSALGAKEWQTDFWDAEQARRKRDGEDLQARRSAAGLPALDV